MRIKLVIFDLDQTLIDTLPRFFKVFNKTLKKYGLREVEWDIFLEKYKADDLDSLISPRVLLDDFWNTFLEIYDEEPPLNDRAIEGAEETLSCLRKSGVKIVVVTGRKSPKEKVWENLRLYGLDKYVDAVFTASSVQDLEFRFSKKELLIKVIRDYGVSEKEVMFVGDYRYDMLSGKKAGVFTVGVLTGHESEEVLFSYGADLVVESVASIPEVLEKLKR